MRTISPSGGSYFTAETHIRHLDEAHAGARDPGPHAGARGRRARRCTSVTRCTRATVCWRPASIFCCMSACRPASPPIRRRDIEAGVGALCPRSRQPARCPTGSGVMWVRRDEAGPDHRRCARASGGRWARRSTPQGFEVWVTDVDADAWRSAPDGWHAHAGDASDEAAMRERVIAQMGGIDVLCANAGIAGPTALVEDVELEDFRRLRQRQSRRRVHRGEIRRPHDEGGGNGAIIITSSTAGLYGLPQPRALCGRQMGDDRPDEDACDGTWPLRHPRQRDLPRLRRRAPHGRRPDARGRSQGHDPRSGL